MLKSKILDFRNNKYLPQAIIIGVILLVYIQNLWFDYVYLDDNLILSIQSDKINSITGLTGAFKGGYLFGTYYRPIVMISFILDTMIAGQSLIMYHLTNIVIHLLVSLLFYNLLLKFRIGEILSLILTLFFAVHPIQVNAVSWIVGRNDLLLALFALMSFLAFIKYTSNKNKIFFNISLITYFLAMLTKESGIVIPMVFVFHQIFFGENQKPTFRNYLVFIFYAIPVAIYFSLRLFMADIIIKDGIGIQSLFKNIYVFFEYVAKIFYFPAIEPLPMKDNLLVILGIFLFLALILTGIKIIKDIYYKKLFTFGIITFAFLILPSLLVKIVSIDGNFNYIDCRTYLPLIGIFISFGAIFSSVKFSKAPLIILILIWILYSLSFNYIKNQTYRNGKVFWETVTRFHPQRADYWIGLGTYYFNMQNYEKAAFYGEKAIGLNPEVTEYYEKTANAYIKIGNINSAIIILNKVLNKDVNKSKNLYNLILLYYQVEDRNSADRILNELENIADDKISNKYLYFTGEFYYKKGNIGKALEIIKILINKEKTNATYINFLGVLYSEIGDMDNAKKCFFQASQLAPNNLEYFNNLRQVK
jgi:tetratricopeptide (TPR) repeat protein